MISRTSHSKVSMYPNKSKNISRSASIIDPLDQPIEESIEPKDKIDEMKLDYEISFCFQPENKSIV